MVGVVLRENTAMRELAPHSGFELDADKPREPGVVALVRRLPRS